MSAGSVAQPRTFRHGVHPQEHKEQTEHLSLQRMPFVERYILPLRQHLGAPCKPTVKVGDRVERGQAIAEPAAFVSMMLHAPVTGTVRAIGPHRVANGSMEQSIEIEADPFSSQRIVPFAPIDPGRMSVDSFVNHVGRSGLVGLGGAAFPTHVKYKLPEGRRCQRLLINGCECEPYLTCDHRLMVEHAERIIRGTAIVATVLKSDEATIGVEMNKPDGMHALQRALDSYQASHDCPPIRVVPLRVKYPQGAEKMLIKAVYDLEVPAGKLPIDIDIVVNNVASMAAMTRWFDEGIPLIERAMTVAGPGVDRPANLIVPVGTPVRDVLNHCGLRSDTRQVIMGGPMMGQPLASLDVPVQKGTSGLLAFTDSVISHPTEYACVKCGRCLEACGNLLNPSLLARLSQAERWDALTDEHVMDCMECGACTFTCPSGVPIVHLIRAAKAGVRRHQARKAETE